MSGAAAVSAPLAPLLLEHPVLPIPSTVNAIIQASLFIRILFICIYIRIRYLIAETVCQAPRFVSLGNFGCGGRQSRTASAVFANLCLV